MEEKNYVWEQYRLQKILSYKSISQFKADMAKVRRAGRMQPSKKILRPLCQIWDAPLSYLDTIM